MGTEGTSRCGLNRKKGKETYGDEQEGIDVVVVIGGSGGRGWDGGLASITAVGNHHTDNAFSWWLFDGEIIWVANSKWMWQKEFHLPI